MPYKLFNDTSAIFFRSDSIEAKKGYMHYSKKGLDRGLAAAASSIFCPFFEDTIRTHKSQLSAKLFCLLEPVTKNAGLLLLVPTLKLYYYQNVLYGY